MTAFLWLCVAMWAGSTCLLVFGPHPDALLSALNGICLGLSFAIVLKHRGDR